MFKVFLNAKNGSLEFLANTHRSVLECAEEFEIYMPSSCRNGTCRTCLTQTHSGTVRYEIGWPGLSEEEKVTGWILPCVAIACSDLRMTQHNAYLI
jgi:ferredoxin